jgi:hypothetical protein
MTRVRQRGEEIRRFILENVQANQRKITRLAAERFGVTRQAIHQQIAKLVEAGALTQHGKTMARTYALAPQERWINEYPIPYPPGEDTVWRHDVRPRLDGLSDNVLALWAHAFTEMFNNALDHSRGSRILFALTKTAVTTEMMIADDGIGIFKKIQTEKGLIDESHAILELSKGKLTTDPAHHTGEGIFFTSRMCDSFEILSGGRFFSHDISKAEDWLIERKTPDSGTAVFMKIGNHIARTVMQVIDRFTTEDEDETRGFDKTIVPIRLAQYSSDLLVSRSQAKRVLARLEGFKRVILDFEGVETIGQAFSDEIFRVFSLSHPEVSLRVSGANDAVMSMVRRAAGDVRAEPRPSDEGTTSAGVVSD